MSYSTKEQRAKIKNITQNLWDTYNLTKQLTLVSLHEKFPKEKLLSHLDIDCKEIRKLRNEERRRKRGNVQEEKSDDIMYANYVNKKLQKENLKLRDIIEILEEKENENDLKIIDLEDQVDDLKITISKYEKDSKTKNLEAQIDELRITLSKYDEDRIYNEQKISSLEKTVSSLTNTFLKKSSQIDELNIKILEQGVIINQIKLDLKNFKRNLP